MRNSFSIIALLLFSFLSADTLEAKRFRFTGGGEISKSSKDEDTCKLTVGDLLITLSSEVKGLKNKPDKLVLYFHVRVENPTEGTQTFEFPPESYLKEASGQIYRYTEPDAAIDQLINRSAGFRTVLVGGLAGPLAGAAVTDAVEKEFRGRYGANALRSGMIPAHSFIEGIVFFEPFKNDDKRPLELVVPGWPSIALDYR